MPQEKGDKGSLQR